MTDQHPSMSTASPADFRVAWQDRLTSMHLDALSDVGVTILDDVFSHQDLQALQIESGFVAYRQAQLTAGTHHPDIRGDSIRWIEPEDHAGHAYLHSLLALSQLLNRTLFTGIRHCEAHYACYPIGYGYHWHCDNPKGRDERVISAVYYLNDDWRDTDGGALEIIDKQGQSHTVMPVANRLVLFDSDQQHQVHIAHRQRYSIATWFRRDDAV